MSFIEWLSLFEWISLIGSIASIVGLPIALYQIYKIKSNTQITNDAIVKTSKEILRTYSIVDIAKYCAIIKLIQNLLNSSKYEIAVYQMRELKEVMIELKELRLLDIGNFKEEMSSHIISIGTDISNLQKQISANKNVKIEIIIDNLDKIARLLNEVQAKLKHQNHE